MRLEALWLVASHFDSFFFFVFVFWENKALLLLNVWAQLMNFT